MSDDRPVVLVVEDEADLAAIYAEWLGDAYEVRVATDGASALEAYDGDVAVALLDRRMPDRSGDEVLAAIRERGDGCRVAMVTAVEPDFDVLDLGFDDYLQKPISREELVEVVERLLALATYDRAIQEFYGLLSKRSALEAEKAPQELEASEEYDALVERIERRQRRVDATLGDLTPTEYDALFEALGRRGGPRYEG